MLCLVKPDNFIPKFEVVSCFLEYEGKILLLLRQDCKNEPNTYGVPAGKVELNESVDIAVSREIFEETGMKLSDISYFKKVYVKYPTYDFVYYIYHKKLIEKPRIKIDKKEHKKYIWKNPEEALKENLIQDLDNCIKLFYNV
ncbi:MAG TPA: NUDIX hydrolase [Candidatus Absconditabacterales bacterium]|nr:NUDIX hydrolase [Candidatus Absconditabacterales bacterium]